MAEVLAFAIMLSNGIGQLAVIAILFGTLQRHRSPPLLQAVLTSTLFAVCGLIAMSEPARFDNGVVVDLRGVITGLAGAFGGWPAALATALATCLYRIHLGGIYVAGCASIVFVALLGLAWRWLTRHERSTRLRYLLALGGLIALHPLPLLFVPATWNVHTLLPTLSTLLLASLAGAIAFGKLVEREMRQIAQERLLVREALHDPLTNLLNRRGFESAFVEARGLDQDAPLALLLIDIDHFKSVNDRFGHDVGDLVLQTVAHGLQAQAGRFERCSRHGGEEFAVLLPRSNAAAAVQRAEAIRTAIEGLETPRSGGEPIRATVSIGIAACGDGRTPLADLFQNADNALYRAKGAGRNRAVLREMGSPAPVAAGAWSLAPA
ncbi:GGDEF domain-containing protein [Aureimonas jatrophae]|uniref:diguanylate cyclase n=1 Tax=Aureimonas jatrophae TaxID=1166073 RepID=A0A1H0M1M9_9HYPH|nr:diguanylate cyclase [Aureimonas jatrophae]MBB3952669.1 diguanylate cyclase [Aureimonas jatrophae]SDO74201.1 diguanylate cyclase [Aureimonas jatrophae]